VQEELAWKEDEEKGVQQGEYAGQGGFTRKGKLQLQMLQRFRHSINHPSKASTPGQQASRLARPTTATSPEAMAAANQPTEAVDCLRYISEESAHRAQR